MSDLTNGLFEAVGAAFLLLNVLQLHRDKQLKGVDWRAVAFFFSWGIWNLFYYPSLGQFWSFCGAVLIVAMNFAWLALVGYYALQHRRLNLNLRPLQSAEIQAE